MRSSPSGSVPGGAGSAPAEDAGPLHAAARSVADNLWGERGARIGLAAGGLVYLVLGYLVIRIALGGVGASSTSKSASGPGVAQAVAAQPGGRVALVVLGVGLELYALFSLLDAILHHDDESPAAKRWGDRVLSTWGFLLYGAFGIYCFTTAASSSAGKQRASQSDSRQTQWSARVLRWPAGWLWLGLLGAVLIGIAAFLVSRCIRRSFANRFDRADLSRRGWRVTMALGVLGYSGRAGLFALVGSFVLAAAAENDPRKGQGFDGSARSLANSSAGPYVLWVLALLLISYGGYMFIEARLRKV